MNRQTENGNAIFLIIMGVALFAALGYAFTSSNRSSTTLVTDEQANAYANQIIAYSNEIKQTVKRLQLRGCNDTEISFENDTVSGYTNPNAPTSKKCHVFDIAGGGLSYNLIAENKMDQSQSAEGFYRQVVFFGGLRVTDIKSTSTELLMYVPFLNQTICQKINDNFNLGTIENDVFGGGGGGGTFNGESNDFDQFATPDLGDEATNVAGKNNFCVEYGGSYHYFNVLIAR